MGKQLPAAVAETQARCCFAVIAASTRSAHTRCGFTSHLPRALASHQPARFAAARQAVACNAAFLGAMLATYEGAGVPDHLRVPPRDQCASMNRPTPGESEKVRYVLRNLVRDWCGEGEEERRQCYAPLLAALSRHVAPYNGPPAAPPRVLVPGAGLGRLCCELAGAGYSAEGCEVSYYMLLSSSFLMNVLGGGDDVPVHTIHPWVLHTCNNVLGGDPLRGLAVPDVRACTLVATAPPQGLGMAAGDFGEVYAAPEYAGEFDAVVTCFFIDVTHNVLHTIDVIAAALKPGGVWVHQGPLLYHWADAHTYLDTNELSIELPLEDVKAAALAAGFEVLEEGSVECRYADNRRGMMHTVYNCASWTMRKKPMTWQ